MFYADFLHVVIIEFGKILPSVTFFSATFPLPSTMNLLFYIDDQFHLCILLGSYIDLKSLNYKRLSYMTAIGIR